MLHGNKNLDDNTLEIAKYISKNYSIKVYYSVSKQYLKFAREILPENVILVQSRTVKYVLKWLTSQYIFFTTGPFLNSFSKRQVSVNVWHGVLYKRVKKLRGYRGIPASITVGTSPLTQNMFAEAFGVKKENVILSGYPRNDAMIAAHQNKCLVKNKISGDIHNCEKIIIWLPTFRQNKVVGLAQDGSKMDNPFNLDKLEIDKLNQILVENKAICLVKPHPVAQKHFGFENLSNLLFIDDFWVAKRGITLYQLIGCSDMLISDVSSVIIDYLLLDKPIICALSDFESYKKTRGFYFEDMHNWLPSDIFNEQEGFLNHLNEILKTGKDPFEQKRKDIKNKFFTHNDTNSAERLVKYVLKNEN